HRALSVRPSPPPLSTRFPYTTLFRSHGRAGQRIGDALCANWFEAREEGAISVERFFNDVGANLLNADTAGDVGACSVAKCLKARSEEHTSELQSRFDLVCRLLLEKKN